MNTSDADAERLRMENQALRQELARRQEVERELHESENRFRIIAETIPVPIAIARLEDDTILYANENLIETYGYKREDLIGLTTREFYADPSERVVLLQQLMAKGVLRNYELKARQRDGSFIWLSLSLQSITYQGEPCVLVAFADVTHLKGIEDQLRHERRLLQRLLEVHERDRQLIAYEIHDGIVQQMSGALMFLEAARHAMEAGADSVEADLARAMRLLRESIQEARRLITGLRPPILEEAGVVPAVKNLIEELTIATQLEINYIHDVHFQRLAPALEMAIFRIVQEGLNNVWQHSQSSRAEVLLRQPDAHIEIVIQDWGIGFDPAVAKKRRYGLTGVRERARLLGGQATIESVPHHGTIIRVNLPLEDALLPDPHPTQEPNPQSKGDESN